MRELDNRLMRHIDLLVERYPSLESAKNDIVAAYLLLEESYENGGKLLVAGNGGSAADAEHIVGELMKGFKLPRKPETDFAEKLVAENQELGAVLAENLQGALPAIALDGHPALSTAYMNVNHYFALHSRSMVTVNPGMCSLAFPQVVTVKMCCMRRQLHTLRE
jgi:D-sedoheptulose 7-phosphate isomerase